MSGPSASTPRPPRRRSGGGVGVVVALLAMVVVVAALVAVLPGRGDVASDRGDGLVPADVERGTPATATAPLDADLDVEAWGDELAGPTAAPARALRAYAAAEIAQRAETPDCRLSWTTLAGIGRVESDHGRLGRADLDPDGVPRPEIVGIPLDGAEGVREIRDTDGGALDGDAVYDRAVGPMQFLPTTWARFGADGDGDGVRDPHQIDDAARAAAAYLCDEGRDTSDGDGWWDAVLTYNRSVSYARLVWAAADRYAAAAGAAAAP